MLECTPAHCTIYLVKVHIVSILDCNTATKLWPLQRDSRREERRKFWQGKGSIPHCFSRLCGRPRGRARGDPRVSSGRNPRAPLGAVARAHSDRPSTSCRSTSNANCKAGRSDCTSCRPRSCSCYHSQLDASAMTCVHACLSE